jgi:sugar phosphate isomerase/epimerase
MERRQFIAWLGTAAASPLLSGSLLACARQSAGSGTPIMPIGLQLYTVRDLMQQGVRPTLGLVAEIGYQEVEFAGYFNHTAAEIRAMLDDTGLRSPAAHVALGAVRDDLENTIAFSKVVGHEYLIVPYLPESDRTRDGYQRIGEEFNRIGETCRNADLTFGYHNHDFEFEQFGDTTGFDLLLEHTEADLVVMELDLFWITSGGASPREYFEAHPDRFQLCHVKDMDGQGAMVDVGRGTLDFADLLSVGGRQGLRHHFVEHDRPTDSAESIRRSYEYLASLRI